MPQPRKGFRLCSMLNHQDNSEQMIINFNITTWHILFLDTMFASTLCRRGNRCVQLYALTLDRQEVS